MSKPPAVTELFSLEQAAKKIKCTPNEVLLAGVRGVIQLLIGVPDGTEFRLLEDRYSDRSPGIPRSFPNLLALKISHCQSLYLTGKAIIKNSHLGYRFIPGMPFLTYSPSESDIDLPSIGVHEIYWRDPRKRWTAWAVYKAEVESNFEVSTERVFISGLDLDVYFKNKSSQPREENNEFKSDFLQYMNQAARFFWGDKNVLKDDKSTHPKTIEIVEWFQMKGFTKTLATRAASIIRPDFAGTGRPLDD